MRHIKLSTRQGLSTFRSDSHSSKPMYVRLLVVTCLCVMHVQALNYSMCQEWSGNDFFNHFYWWSGPDPTHGLVDYVNQDVSRRSNLSYVDQNTGNFVLNVDTGDPVPRNGNWSHLVRRSNRIHSNHKFGDGFYILKLARMPTGCGTWPAFWTSTGSTWPDGGEIDIIENANGDGPNLSSLHAGANCNVDQKFNNNQQGYVIMASLRFLETYAYSETSCVRTALINRDARVSLTTTIPLARASTTGTLSFTAISSPSSNMKNLLTRNYSGGGWFAMMRDTRVNGTGVRIDASH